MTGILPAKNAQLANDECFHALNNLSLPSHEVIRTAEYQDNKNATS